MSNDQTLQGHQPDSSKTGCQGDAHHTSQGRRLARQSRVKGGTQKGQSKKIKSALLRPQGLSHWQLKLAIAVRKAALLKPSDATLLSFWLAGSLKSPQLLFRAFPGPGKNSYVLCLRFVDTKLNVKTMNLKETLLKTRDDLIAKRDTLNRDIAHTESLLVSQCGWMPPASSTTSVFSASAISYNKEAKEYLVEIDLIWGEDFDVTSNGFIAWLQKKHGEDAVKENSARGAIVIMERAGLIKIKSEGRGRIGTTYTVVPK